MKIYIMLNIYLLLLALLFRKMENLFENFMKYFENVCLSFFFFEYLGCLMFLCGLFDDSSSSSSFLIIFLFYFCTKLTALPLYGQLNLV